MKWLSQLWYRNKLFRIGLGVFFGAGAGFNGLFVRGGRYDVIWGLLCAAIWGSLFYILGRYRNKENIIYSKPELLGQITERIETLGFARRRSHGTKTVYTKSQKWPLFSNRISVRHDENTVRIHVPLWYIADFEEFVR